MLKVVKREELATWLQFKSNQEIQGSKDYQNGYRDAIENLSRDILEGRLTSHLFAGEEEESIIL